MDPGGRRVGSAINRAALAIACFLLVAIGALWWRDHARLRETPRWDTAGVVELRAATAGEHERWIMAANPDCSRCRERLALLAGVMARRPQGPALGVLLVDVPQRPGPPALAAALSAGVWWDSTATWRRRWGRSAYGEVLVFSPGGSLRRVLRPDFPVSQR
jgi:hypothetical protein